MKNAKPLILLFVSIVAFAGMVLLVTIGVRSRRHARDFAFGLERFDVLVEDGELDEARALLPMLVERAGDVRGVFSVLKRGLAISSDQAGYLVLSGIAQTGLNMYPANGPLRSIAAFALVRAGRPSEALALVRDHESLVAGLYPWVLLENDLRSSDSVVEDEQLYLVDLDRSALPAELERAYLDTGDWRYAVDAVLLHLGAGAKDEAARLLAGASLNLRAPLFAADVHLDRGDPEQALVALSNEEENDEAEFLLRRADIAMWLHDFDLAEGIYRKIVTDRPSESSVPFLNLAVMDPANARSFYDRAVLQHPESWVAVEQRALSLAENDMDAALESLNDYAGNRLSPDRVLLELRLAGDTGGKGFQTRLWELLAADDSPPEAFLLAAWYFYERRDFDELRILLDRSSKDEAWHHHYSGLLAAHHGEWQHALELFLRSVELKATWISEFNAAAAAFAVSDAETGEELLSSALARAEREGFPPGSAELFILRARTAGTPLEGHQAAVRAVELEPGNTQAILLRDGFLTR